MTTILAIIPPSIQEYFFEASPFEKLLYLTTRTASVAFIMITCFGLMLQPRKLRWQYAYNFAALIYCIQGEYFRPNYFFAWALFIMAEAQFFHYSRKFFLIFNGIGSSALAAWIIIQLPKNQLRLQDANLAADYTMMILSSYLVSYVVMSQINKARVEKDKAQSKFILVGKQAVNIIHDLKSLSSAPQIYLSMLAEQATSLNPETEKILKSLESDLKNMTEKTKELYKMVQNQDLSYRTEALDVMMDRAVSFLSTRLKNVTVLREGDGSRVLPSAPIELIVLNLIYNSLDSWAQNLTPEARLNITYSHKHLVLEDNAGGAPEELLKIFNSGGNLNQKGLGLYLIQDSAKSAGLEIELKNTVHQGQKGLRAEIRF